MVERLMPSARNQYLGRSTPLDQATLEVREPGASSSVSVSEVGTAKERYLFFLSLNLFVKPMRLVLETSQHRLESISSIHRRRGGVHHQLTLNERQVMPLCFMIFFIVAGSLPKNFISFSSQMTYSSSVPT